MKKKHRWITAVILLAALLLLLNPQWNLLLSPEDAEAARQALQLNFGFSAGGGQLWTRLRAMLTVLVLVWLLVLAVNGILRLVTAGKKRSRTVAAMVQSLVCAVGVIGGAIWMLNVAGVNTAGILASLGIASLIIGFSAQSLIEDAITGIFIILEGQYNIGDVIVVDDFRGTVVDINIRTTTIMDLSNNLKIINNSSIRNIQNRSRNSSVAVCDVGTSYGEDIQLLEKRILPALPEMYRRNQELFAAEPQYAGVQELGDSAVVLRFTVEVREENYFAARRCLNREIKLLFDRLNIEIPFRQVDVHHIG